MKIIRTIFAFLRRVLILLLGLLSGHYRQSNGPVDATPTVKAMYGGSANPFVLRNTLQVKSNQDGNFPTNIRFHTLLQHAGYGYFASKIVEDGDISSSDCNNNYAQ